MSRVFLRGLGQSAICLDQNQNTISCIDPNCTYGDCGSTESQVTSGALCLDQDENAVACADPNCTYGDCIGAAAKTAAKPGNVLPIAAGLNLPSKPAPTVAVPLSTSIPGSMSLFFSGSTLIAGVPNIAVIGGGALLALLLVSGIGGGKRRR